MKSSWRLAPATLASLLVSGWAVLSAAGIALNLVPFRWLELQAQTLFFRVRGPVAPPKEVVILAIDDSSLRVADLYRNLNELEPIRTWPWRRVAYAQAIEKLMMAGAKSVSIDVVFDLPSDPAEDDQRLRATLQKYAGRITLAAGHTSTPSSGAPLEQMIYPNSDLQVRPESIGLINYVLEPNGQIRRFAGAYLNYAIEENLRRAQSNLLPFAEASLRSANRSVLAPREDQIFFYGGQNQFLAISFWQVLDPKSWQVLQQQQVFKDKIVLIGPTSSFFKDNYPTPFGELPGVEIHASAIATLLEDRAISEMVSHAPSRGGMVFLGLMGVTVVIGWVFKRGVTRFLWSLGAAVIWTAIGYITFTVAGLVFPVAIPIVTITLTGLTYLSVGAVGDQLEKLRLRRTFERYVSPPVVEEILSQPEDFHALLQGRNLNLAILFCDIRGFTYLSYKLPAEELVAQLNVYLNAMVQAVSEADGTIDKFIGDAVMAEFGAPVSRGERTDAINAIKAALKMRKSLAALRRQWQQEGKTPLFHGIGISYGAAIAGNIGSVKRLEYTVIGDAVNVASRVESLTKQFQTDLLITDSLYELVQEQIEAVYMGEQPLRGREETPTRLYGVVGLKGEDATLYYQVQHELKAFFSNHST